jgi:hypothetical protein
MERLYDEFSMSLAASLPRRESLRHIGAALAGAVLSQLGLGTAWARRSDACTSYCQCSNKAQQNQCLAVCRACNNQPSRLVGSCGSYVCCSIAACNGMCSDLRSNPNCGACGNDCSDFGETCCGNYCADLDNDFDNCGACGAACNNPGPYEDGWCVLGECVYLCVEGAVECDGRCSRLDSDRDNCGACGNVCPDETPVCIDGVCSGCPLPNQTNCGGYCAFLATDPYNCGACGHVCLGVGCVSGQCDYGSPPSE